MSSSSSTSSSGPRRVYGGAVSDRGMGRGGGLGGSWLYEARFLVGIWRELEGIGITYSSGSSTGFVPVAILRLAGKDAVGSLE